MSIEQQLQDTIDHLKRQKDAQRQHFIEIFRAQQTKIKMGHVLAELMRKYNSTIIEKLGEELEQSQEETRTEAYLRDKNDSDYQQTLLKTFDEQVCDYHKRVQLQGKYEQSLQQWIRRFLVPYLNNMFFYIK